HRVTSVTNVGGTSGHCKEQLTPLRGANAVAAPDRDVPGVNLMDKVSKELGITKWLYCIPDSFYWKKLPPSNGIDISDWIRDGASLEVILNAITEKKIEPLSPSGSSSEFNEKQKMDNAQLLKAIDDLVAQDPQPSLLEISLFRLSDLSGIPSRTLSSIFFHRKKENQFEEDLSRDDEETAYLLKARSKGFDPSAVIPRQLASEMTKKAHNLQIDPILIFNPFLSATSSMLGNSKVTLKADGSWVEVPPLWTVNCLDPSLGKSLGSKIALKYLEYRQYGLDLDHVEAWKEREVVSEKWKNTSKEDKEKLAGTTANPVIFEKEELKRRIVIIEDATIEGCKHAMSEQPEGHGLLWAFDEISNILGAGRYNRGGDQQVTNFLLQAHNGAFSNPIRKGNRDSPVMIKGQYLAVGGAIQPDLVGKTFNMQTGGNGLTSRFLFGAPRIPENFGQKTKGSGTSLDRMIEDFYDYLWLRSQNNKFFNARFSPSAQDLFNEQEARFKRMVKDSTGVNSCFSSWIGKMSKHLGRIALSIHVMECYYDRSKDEDIITIETLLRAIALANYYIESFKVIQSMVANFKKSDLKGTYLKVWSACQAKGSISYKDVRNSYRNCKDVYKDGVKTYEAKAILQHLSSIGFGYYDESTGTSHKKPPTGGGDGGDNGPPTDPAPQPSPDSGIEQQVREQIREAQIITPHSDYSEPALTGSIKNGSESITAIAIGASQDAMNEVPAKAIALDLSHDRLGPPLNNPLPESPPIPVSTAVMERPPETRQGSGKGFRQPKAKAPVKAPPIKDDRDNPRFRSFKKTGSFYKIADYCDRSVLFTDEFIGFEVASKKLGSIPLKLEEVQCVFERISPDPRNYIVESLESQTGTGKWVVLNTCPPGHNHSPIFHSPEIPLDQIIGFIYSDGQS
ncbi:MAG: DUF3987 domain-containing protein, partial [Moorea sp. SIO3I7]|nr:DUF3987 domain-containing protein [Moorena sp. SIO3I7]